MTSEIRANTLKNRVGLGTVSFTNTGAIVSGIVTVTGADVNGDLDVDGHTNLDNVSVAGVSTFQNIKVSSNQHIVFNNGTWSGNIAAKLQHHNNIFYSQGGTGGWAFLASGGAGRLIIDGDGHVTPGSDSTYNLGATDKRWKNIYADDIDVDGHTNLDNVSIAGVTTITGALFANGFGTHGGEIGLTGTIPRINFTDSNANSDFRIKVDGGSFQIEDITNSSADRLTINSSGNVSINKDLDVDGHTNLDNVSIAGVTTATGAMDVNNILTVTRSGSNTAAIFSGGGGAGNIQIKDGDTGTLAFISVVGGVLHFQTSGNSYSKKLTIKPDGNVGIGSDAPTERFVVQGAGVSNLTYDIDGGGFDSTSGGALVLTGVFDYSGSKLGMMVDNAGQGRIFTKTAQALHFGQSNQKDMTIAASTGYVGINEEAPSSFLDVKGTGVPVVINSSNSNANKIAFEDNGTTKSYIGAGSGTALIVSNDSGNMLFQITNQGVAYNGNTSTHGSGVFMCEIHTDLLRLLKASQNHPNTTGNYYSWADGGTASWTWDHYGMRMDSNVGSHTWQCGSVYLTPGFYTLMQCYKPEPNTHGWTVYGSNSNANRYSLTSDHAYGSYTTYLISDTDQHASNNGRARWYGTTQGNFWYQVTSAGTYRIQQMGQPYGGGGYKYYVLAAYLLKLK